jgi:hypothetical protein
MSPAVAFELVSDTTGPDTGRETRSSAQMLLLVRGFRVAIALRNAAGLGLADLLKDGPRTLADLLEIAAADRASLEETLDVLVAAGVFQQTPSGKFATTPLGRTLESDRPGSLRSVVLREIDL